MRCRPTTTWSATWRTSPSKANLEDLQAKALRERPDFQAALLGVTAAQSQILLAKANAKVDVNGTYDFTHTAGQNSASIFVSFDLPIFNRNQGEIARTRYALTQAQETQQSASDTVMSDVANAYEAVRSNDEIVQLYTSEYLKQAQDSRDISEYAYKRGRGQPAGFSGRRTQLPGGPTGLSPGPGFLYDGARTTETGGRNEEPAMKMRNDTGRGRRAFRRSSGLGMALSVIALAFVALAGASRQGRIPRQPQCRGPGSQSSRTVHHPAGADVARAGGDGRSPQP